MAVQESQISPPFSPPDCPWVSMTEGSKLPENAFEAGTLNGDLVYIGRVFDDGCYLVGSALPNKGICLYLNKKLEIKSTSSYDMLCQGTMEPLEFQSMAIDHSYAFVSAGDEETCLYTCRVVDGENTYVGWADQEAKTVYIPRDAKLGPNKLTDNYDILVHTLLHMLCICPPAPTPPF